MEPITRTRIAIQGRLVVHDNTRRSRQWRFGIVQALPGYAHVDVCIPRFQYILGSSFYSVRLLSVT